MGKGKAAEEVAEKVFKDGSKKAAEKAAKRKAKIAEAKKAAAAAKERAEAAKRGLLGKGADWAKAHPKSAIAAGTLGGATVLGGGIGIVGGISDALGSRSVDVPDVLPPAPTPAGGGALPGVGGMGAGSDGGSTGEVEWDTDTINAIIAGLRQEATALEPLLSNGAFEAFRAELASDSLHTRTRSGGPSPVLAPLDDAVVKTATAYHDVVQGLITQLTGDANRLADILAKHEDDEAENVARINSIDTEGL